MSSNKNKFQSLVGYEKVLDNNVKGLNNNMSKLIFDRYVESISKVLSNTYHQEFVDSLVKYTVKLLNKDNQDYFVSKYDYLFSKLITDEDINSLIGSVSNADDLKDNDKFLLKVYKVAINNLKELIDSLGMSENNEVLYQLSSEYYDLRLRQSDIEEDELLELMDDLDKLVELEVSKLKGSELEGEDIVSVDTSYMDDLLIENSLNGKNDLDKESSEDSVLNFVDDDSSSEENVEFNEDSDSDLSVDEDDFNLNIDLTGVVNTLDDAELNGGDDLVEVSGDDFDFSKDINTSYDEDEFEDKGNNKDLEGNEFDRDSEDIKNTDDDSQYVLDFGYDFKENKNTDEVEGTEVEDIEVEDIEVEDIEVEDIEVEDIEVEDTDVEDIEVEDVEVEDTEIEDTEIEDTEIEDTEIEDTEVEDKVILVDGVGDIIDAEDEDEFVDDVVESVPRPSLVDMNEVDEYGNGYKSEVVDVHVEDVDLSEDVLGDEDDVLNSGDNFRGLDSLKDVGEDFNIDDYADMGDGDESSSEYTGTKGEPTEITDGEDDYGINLGQGYNFEEDDEDDITVEVDKVDNGGAYQQEIIDMSGIFDYSDNLSKLIGEDEDNSLDENEDKSEVSKDEVVLSSSVESKVDEETDESDKVDESLESSKEESLFSKDKLSEFLGLKNIN